MMGRQGIEPVEGQQTLIDFATADLIEAIQPKGKDFTAWLAGVSWAMKEQQHFGLRGK